LFFLAFTLFFIASAFCQRQYLILTLQLRTNENIKRHIKIFPGKQFIKVKTRDSTFYLNTVFSVTDTSICAEYFNDKITVPLKNITLIKKMTGRLEWIGNVILETGIAGLALYVPINYEFYGKEEAIDALIETAAVFTFSIPFIIIGTSTTRYKMEKWKIVSVIIPGK